MKNVAIIMAGGNGTRLWPLSNQRVPKQFLPLLDNEKTMIQLTVDRIKDFISLDDIFVVTTSLYESLVTLQLPEIKRENIVIQPLNKNTAPCIAFTSKIIEKRYKDANVIVLASDHDIKNKKLFIDCFQRGLHYLDDHSVITIGIVPTRIETGYGYIQVGDKIDNGSLYKAKKFVEKPDFQTAKEYYESGEYLWNSGMFMWKNSFISTCIKKMIPDIAMSMDKIVEKMGTKDYHATLLKEYQTMQSISIDYAIMEKLTHILVIPGNFGWDDVGNWNAVKRLKGFDENNNILDGNIVVLDSSNNIIVNKNNDVLVSTIGLDNKIIIHTKNNVLIMNNDCANDIGKLLDKIKKHDLDRYL